MTLSRRRCPSREISIEGWYVARAFRRRGIGAKLLTAAERWSKKLGCREMASDTWASHRRSRLR